MIGATEIRECIASGLSVRLERGGKLWVLPAAYSFYRQGVQGWQLFDRIWPGDRLLLPEQPAVVLAMPVYYRNAVWFSDRVSLWGDGLQLLCAPSTIACPLCGTTAAHPIDIPTTCDWTVLRTCITCDHSWPQKSEPTE